MTDPMLQTRPRPYDYETFEDLKSTEYIRALVYGVPKVGKTALALTFPRPAVADFDGYGVKVMKSKWFRTTYTSQLQHIRFKQFGDERDEYGLPVNANAFMESMAWLNAVIQDPERDTIVIDSLTMLSVCALAAVLPVLSRRGGRSKTWDNAKHDHMLLLTQADFGGEMGVVEQFLDQIHKIHDKHVLVLAHEREETTPSGALRRRSPLITGGKLRAKIAHWFDEVWYLESDPQGKRILHCNPFDVCQGVGSRLGLPDIPDPSYEKIITHLKEDA